MKCDDIQCFLILIHFILPDDSAHYFNTEEPDADNGPPTNCVYMTTGGYPCKSVFTYEGIEYRFGSCAPGSPLMGSWCYDVRGAGNWGRCTVDSDGTPTCSKDLNGLVITI